MGQQRHALRRREVHFRAQRTHRCHEGLELAHPFDGGCVHALQLRFRIGSVHQAVYVVLGLAASHRGHSFPQLGRDEGGERVQQTQDGFQGADQRAARGALFRRPALLDLHLGDLQVPVAVLVPDEAVERVGHVVQAVLGKALLHRSLHTLDLAADPAVNRREAHVAVEGAGGLRQTAIGIEHGRGALGLGVLLQPAVLILAVHQHEARGVPQLVAEVAVALAALGVEVDVPPEARVAGHGEAQRVGTIGRHALRELFPHPRGHLGRGLGFAQAGGALVDQGVQVHALDQVHRVEHVALGLAHLLAFAVAHHPVDVDVAKGHLAREVGGHHDHPGDPEEDDLVAGDQHGRRQKKLEVLRLGGPAE